MIRRFPDGFWWGAATSAHQVEGGNRRNDWWRFEQRPGATRDGRTSGDACLHYQRFDEDWALAAADGHRMHRLSLEWSRIEPEPGRFDAAAIAHYHAVLGALRRRGLTPLVTLHHFTNPLWIADRGGWENPETIACFVAFARFCAREFGLPMTIARMGSAYGDRGGLPAMHLEAIAEGRPVVARWDPLPYSPIHYDDINAQLEALLDAATVPATIVNWAGDVPVSVQEWSKYFGELLGVEVDVPVQPVSGASLGSVGDHTKRASITGPCRVEWRDGFRSMAAHLYPDRVQAG